MNALLHRPANPVASLAIIREDPYDLDEQISTFVRPHGLLFTEKHAMAETEIQHSPMPLARSSNGISRRGWIYAKWLADVPGRAEQGEPHDLR